MGISRIRSLGGEVYLGRWVCPGVPPSLLLTPSVLQGTTYGRQAGGTHSTVIFLLLIDSMLSIDQMTVLTK